MHIIYVFFIAVNKLKGKAWFLFYFFINFLHGIFLSVFYLLFIKKNGHRKLDKIHVQVIIFNFILFFPTLLL